MSLRIRLQEAFKFSLSIVLFYWLALWMDWDLTLYGPMAIALVSLSTSGASINKGAMRVVGTVIGCIAGLALVEWFSQARWNMMFALAAYLASIGYFLQTSRYPYAWYVSGIVPLVIWADTYGVIDNTFHFAIFRLLETSAGVLIYLVISLLLWPQTADKQFYRLGGEYLDKLCQLMQIYQAALSEKKRDDIQVLQRKLDALLIQLQATLVEAMKDSMLIREQQQEWADVVVTLRTLTDKLMLLWNTDEMSLQIDQQEERLALESALLMVEHRCARAGQLWGSSQLSFEVSTSDDLSLLQVLPMSSSSRTMHKAELGLLINRGSLLHDLNQESLKLLTSLRVLSGVDSTALSIRPLQPLVFDKPACWEWERLFRALVPALAFIIGFLFWIFPDTPPPGGNSIAMFSGLFGLLVPMGISFRHVALAHAIGGLAIAPLYFIVMPWLDGGVELLTMIFLVSFTFDYLDKRWPMVKLGGIILFAMVASISNHQAYSFIKWVNLEFTFIIALIIINVVVMFMMPIYPEKILLRRVKRFFRACAAICNDLALLANSEGSINKKGARGLREVRMAAENLRAVRSTLDYSLFPANTEVKVNDFIDSVQSIAERMRLLNVQVVQLSANGYNALLDSELPCLLQKIFEHWEKITAGTGELEHEKRTIEVLYQQLEQRLEVYHKAPEMQFYNKQAASDLIAFLGGVRGLLDAMDDMGRSIHDIHWNKWAEVHF